MKKLAFTIVCALAVTGAAFAQGAVNWSLINPGAMTAQTNTTQGSPIFGGGSIGAGAAGDIMPGVNGATYYFELLYNTNFNGTQVAVPNASVLFGGTWLDTGLTATNSNHPGWLTPVNPNGIATVPWAQGTTNNILLVGWSANLGTSWATVSNVLANRFYFYISSLTYFGESATGYLTPNTSPALGAMVFNNGADANGLPINSLDTQLYLLPIPEPGTVALTGLGGLSLLLFRRRK